MKTNHLFKIYKLVQTGVLSAMLIFASTTFAVARSAYIVDLNSGKVTDIGSLGGGDVYATAMNDTGQVVGDLGDGGSFITGPNGVGMTRLETLGKDSVATGINATGQVVGEIFMGRSLRAFITGPNGVGITDLGTLGGSNSWASGVNDRGQVAGESETVVASPGEPKGYSGFITGPNGAGMSDLGIQIVNVTGINDKGQVVGRGVVPQSQHPPGYLGGFLTGPEGMGLTNLGSLGYGDTWPTAINDAGQVVGWSGDHAFITGANGAGMTDLGTLGGHDSLAVGVNDMGQVIGWSYMPDGSQHFFITGPNGVSMTDLNSLINLPARTVLTDVVAINNMAQILVLGIPEPASYVLMIVGLGLVSFVARRRKAR